MQGFFNIAAVRETANIWRFKLDALNSTEAPFTFEEIDPNQSIEQDMNSFYYTVEEIVQRIQTLRNSVKEGEEEKKEDGNDKQYQITT